MTKHQHITSPAQPPTDAQLRAAEAVVCILLDRLSRKRARKARAAIERFIEHYETFEGRYLPANVTLIRSRPTDEQLEVERRQRLCIASAARAFAAPVLS